MAVEYFEDFQIGAEYSTHARTITETDIVSFVNLFGFSEPLFIDMEFVKNQSLFGSRIAPGSFTFALSEGITIQSGLARQGMALLGVQDMKIPAPLYCGDTVHIKVKVVNKRETSKPDRGVVTSEQQVVNHKGDVLLQYTVNRMIRRRPISA
jgi:acyl dehydratase